MAVISKGTKFKDRFGRSRKKMRELQESARQTDNMEDFLAWYRAFIYYTSTISKPYLTGTARDDKMMLAAMGFASEAGEFSDVFKKVYFHDKKRVKTMDPARRKKAILEAGDALWYFFVGLNELGIDIREVLQANMDKLAEDDR